MLLDDPFEAYWIALAIPSSFRVDNSDRPVLTNPQAVSLGPQHTTALRQPEFLKTSFQVVPGRSSTVFLTTPGIRLVTAQEDVPRRAADTNRLHRVALAFKGARFD